MKKHVIILLVVAVLLSYCKKETQEPPTNETTDDVARLYENAGFGYLGRFDTYTPDVPASYYITPLDIREAQGKIYASWQMEQTFNYSTFVHIYSGTLEGGKFTKTNYEACGDAGTDSDYHRVLNHEFDGQGNLFTSYRYRVSNSMSVTWFHNFCCSTGLSDQSDYTDYAIDMAENNQVVTAVGAQALYNGYELPNMKYYTYGYSGWENNALTAVKPKVQNYDYYVSENGNGFLAYTDAPQGDQVNGNMNLLVFNGALWMDLGSVATRAVRKLTVNYFEAFQVRIIRNGDNPFVILNRDDNTIAVFWFNGTSLQMVSENAAYPSNTSTQFTLTTKTDFCVYQNKLITYGYGNSTGLVDNPRAIYQLNGESFQVLKTVEASNINLRGVYSNNARLWAACEVFRANNGVFTSPVDIIEIK